MGAAYLVVAWLVIQVASTVAPQLNLPEWAPRLITLVVLLGFPVAAGAGVDARQDTGGIEGRIRVDR